MSKLKTKEILIPLLIAIIICLFFYGLGSALLPLIFSSLGAYACLPVVKKLEARGLSRNQAALLVMILVFLVVTLLLLLALPPLIDEFRQAMAAAPNTLSSALAKLNTLLSSYGVYVPYDGDSLKNFVAEYSEKISGEMVASLATFIKKSLANVSSAIVVLLSFVMIPVFFFYETKDYEKIRSFLLNIVPHSWRPHINEFLENVDIILSGYVRGQFLVCIILSLLYTCALFIAGVPFALIIGIMTGFLSIIPYLGFSLGFSLAFLSALASFEGMGPIIGLCLGYGIVQFLESFIITPRIVGDKVGLTPFEAILALIIVGNLLGFVGLFLGIPIGAVIKIFILMLLR
ncbi:MAG: AI-2E family transporter [Bdellovibrionaceae bacterium]|nr:AI-2E family transporter [Pseudobdellovibrionaceae bacterium]